jgi:hypothetical protein
MDNLLQGLDHVTVYIDDILVTGKTEEKHLRTLDEVLARLENAGVRLKREKCMFMADDVIYLGHRISKEGIRPTDDEVRAITATPRPTSVSELRAFLGLVNFYGKFMSNLSTVLAPLYKLLRKGVAWRWKLAQDKAFEKAKELLKSPQLLVHYDANKELILTCDASPYGLGAVLAHRMEDGSERPIEYASRTLSPAEKNRTDRQGSASNCLWSETIPQIPVWNGSSRPQAPDVHFWREPRNLPDSLCTSTEVGSHTDGVSVHDRSPSRRAASERRWP